MFGILSVIGFHSAHLCRKILPWREHLAGLRPRWANCGRWWAGNPLPPSLGRPLVQLSPDHPWSSSGVDSITGHPRSPKIQPGEEYFPRLGPVWSYTWGNASCALRLGCPHAPNILKSLRSKNTGLYPQGQERRSLLWLGLQMWQVHPLARSCQKFEVALLLLASEAPQECAA